MKISFVFLLTLWASFLLSQMNSSNPDIFIDCQTNCDNRYIRQELNFVNHMQNRDEADIFILITAQRSGSGGREIQYIFTGNEDFGNRVDTTSISINPDDSDSEQRDDLLEGLRNGLLPYLLMTDLKDRISFEIEESEDEDGALDKIHDPWNFWVFNIGGSMDLDGESRFKSQSFNTRFNARRITDASKFWYNFRFRYSQDIFELSDGEEFSSFIRNFNNNLGYVHSINDHWSAGFRASGGSSTFGNTDFDISVKPAIEYNYFPYKEANTRRMSFQYSIGPEYKDYTDSTIYNKLEEVVMRHSISAELEQVQKWGNFDLEAGFSQYFHDLKFWSVYLNPNLEWIIFKGLRLSVGGFASYVADRINIAKSDISDNDILLQIKQLNTSYSYFTYVGMNYRFGSKYNNFVNPRF